MFNWSQRFSVPMVVFGFAASLFLSVPSFGQEQMLSWCHWNISLQANFANPPISIPIPNVPAAGAHLTVEWPPNHPGQMLYEIVQEDFDSVGDGTLKWRFSNNSEYDEVHYLKWHPIWGHKIVYGPYYPREEVEYEVDASGTGFYKTWNGVSGQLTMERHCTNGVADGVFVMFFGSGQILGQFDHGKPVGLWTFAGTGHTPPTPGKWTIKMTNRTYWSFPDISQNQVDPGSPGTIEGGWLVDGLPDGYWYNGHLDSKTPYYLFTSNGTWHAGHRDGEWHYYKNDNIGALAAIVQFKNGVVSGTVTGFVPGNISILTVTGPVMSVTGPLMSVTGTVDGVPEAKFDFANSGPWAFRDPKYWDPSIHVSGLWTYRGPNGVVIGQSDLTTGSGHLRQLYPTGVLQAEGEIQGGQPDGDWMVYDWFGRPQTKVTFKNGTFVTEVSVVPPLPVFGPP